MEFGLVLSLSILEQLILMIARRRLKIIQRSVTNSLHFRPQKPHISPMIQASFTLQLRISTVLHVSKS